MPFGAPHSSPLQQRAPILEEGIELHTTCHRLFRRGHDTLLACMGEEFVLFTLVHTDDSIVIVRRSSKTRRLWGRTTYVAYVCTPRGTIEKRIVTERRRALCSPTWTRARLAAHEASDLYEMLTAYSRQLVRT